jgi:hypothetical protein
LAGWALPSQLWRRTPVSVAGCSSHPDRRSFITADLISFPLP